MKKRKIWQQSIAVMIGLISIVVSSQTMAHNLSAADSGIFYRQGAFHIIGTHFGAMGAVMKGKADYDATAFQEHAEAVSQAANLVVNNGFVTGTESGDKLETEAKADIWLEAKGFNQKATNFLEATVALAEESKKGDLEAIKPVFMSAAKTCKACHKVYREKD
jgi:cytochrome c556